MTELLSISINTGHEEKNDVLSQLLGLLIKEKNALIITDYDLELILDEALTNAMEHGNEWQATDKVLVKLSEDDTSFTIVIGDSGSGFDHPNHPRLLDANDLLRLRGRGIYIMRYFCNVRWNKEGNEITLVVAKKKKK